MFQIELILFISYSLPHLVLKTRNSCFASLSVWLFDSICFRFQCMNSFYRQQIPFVSFFSTRKCEKKPSLKPAMNSHCSLAKASKHKLRFRNNSNNWWFAVRLWVRQCVSRWYFIGHARASAQHFNYYYHMNWIDKSVSPLIIEQNSVSVGFLNAIIFLLVMLRLLSPMIPFQLISTINWREFFPMFRSKFAHKSTLLNQSKRNWPFFTYLCVIAKWKSILYKKNCEKK